MPPVRVKVWLFSMTRRTYTTIQACVFVVLLTGLGVSWCWPRPTAAAANQSASLYAIRLVRMWLPWVLLVFLLGEGIETWLVLRQFTRKQAETDRAFLPPPEL
jgi:hypothetical protein